MLTASTNDGPSKFVRTYTFPSCLPDPDRLVVQTRPVVVRAAPTRSLRFQGRAALRFGILLRQGAGGSLTTHPDHTPLHGGTNWRK